MPHRVEFAITFLQWLVVWSIGLFTSIVPMYSGNWQQVVWTIVSMASGTIVSHIIKKYWLNRKK